MLGVVSTALTGIAVATAPAATAHPLGNFTVNYYSGIRVEPREIEVNLVVDRAEIPTLQAFPDAAAGRRPAGADSWRGSQCALLASQANLQVAGSRLPLRVVSSRLAILSGAAGLATSRLECTLRTSSSVQVVGQAVTYQAATTSGRVGWHEVTARGDGTTLVQATVPERSISKELTRYPQDLLSSPLDQRTASFEVRAGSGRVTAGSASEGLAASPLRGLDRFTDSYTNLVARNTLTPAFALLAIALSVLLGGLHAFAPGHGKTLMAAFLIGREGTWRQAAVIGLSVTVTHTVGVLVLGVALSAAALAAPEQVYPWLGLLSGILLTLIGVTLLRSARHPHQHGPGGHTHGPGGHTHGPSGHTHTPVRSPSASGKSDTADARTALVGASRVSRSMQTTIASGDLSPDPLRAGEHRHEHEHHHDDDLHHERARDHADHHDHANDHVHANANDHDHDHDQAALPTSRFRRGNWRLAAVGLAGGLVPSPSALLVLLGGVALGRAWFGALLVLFYGIGMAAALVGTGLLLVLARDRVEQWSTLRPGRRGIPGQGTVLRVIRALPMLTAVAVITVGAWIALRSLMTL